MHSTPLDVGKTEAEVEAELKGVPDADRIRPHKVFQGNRVRYRLIIVILFSLLCWAKVYSLKMLLEIWLKYDVLHSRPTPSWWRSWPRSPWDCSSPCTSTRSSRRASSGTSTRTTSGGEWVCQVLYYVAKWSCNRDCARLFPEFSLLTKIVNLCSRSREKVKL